MATFSPDFTKYSRYFDLHFTAATLGCRERSPLTVESAVAVPRPAAPMFRRLKSRPALLLALIAVLLPFVPLLSHRLDTLALIALPLSLIAARMERDAA